MGLGAETRGASANEAGDAVRVNHLSFSIDDDSAPLVTARAEISGQDLGPLTPTFTAAGFGFSEPPRRAALVAVRPLLHDPAGRLPH